MDQNSKNIRTYLINFIVKHEIENFVRLMANDEYLFQVENEGNKPISSVEVYRILNIVATIVGIEEIEPYTLKKTFGYWNYRQNKDITSLQKIFNHSAPSITLRYIGIE